MNPTPADLPDGDALLQQAVQLRDRSDPEVKAIVLKSELTKFRARFQFDDISVEPAGVADEFSRKAAAAFDEARATEARELRKALQVAEDRLVAAQAASSHLRMESALHAKGTATERLLARLLDTIGGEAAERRLAGLSMRQIASVYATTPDGADRALVAAVERGLDAGTLPLRDDTDADALMRLQRLVADRRAQRVPEAITKGLETVRGIRQNDILMALFKTIEQGGRR